MSDKPISPLRQRMIDDMAARRFSEKVQKAYVRHVKTFAAFLGRPPDTATSDDLRRYQLHMAQQQISAGSINAAIAALRFSFTVTLERPDLVRPLRLVNELRKAPVVLSQAEVARLEVADEQGRWAVSRLHGPEAGLVWTTITALGAAQKALNGAANAGYQTPASALGKDFVLEGEGVTREDVV
jgi:hypothetical protein